MTAPPLLATEGGPAGRRSVADAPPGVGVRSAAVEEVFMTAPPGRVSATALPGRVDAALAGFLSQQAATWSGPDRRSTFTAVRSFVLSGGKRLRPAFCYWGWRGAVDPDTAAPQAERVAIIAGAALELFHCFALIHDDIIDGSSLRRGEPSLHEVFAAAHTAHGWRGDPVDYGRGAALLCGDLCAVWADQLFGRCGAPPHLLRQAQELFAVTRAEAIAGEHLDTLAQAVGGFGSVQRALEVARLKTARYSIVRPLQLGAILAGGSPALLDAYATVGDPLGEAFQLRDDVLGVFGDPAVTGKSTLDDLRVGKATVLLALAFAQATPVWRRALVELVGDPELDEDGADMIKSIMVDCGALAATESRISLGHEQALAAIAGLPVPAEVAAALSSLANLAVSRSS
ncbi:geranylgeranyl diphosphate synthase type I [Allocatelliglobosispora scoriae]|uniref:Geranylgeranyl diphosphate synthase type I n=1 Tax=Allocatelliglobosispora scoriae TaxID=643052 RepID=A0A841BQT4_9ACTN|nr:polyprenyl synthetase family protein [Allocatelliglobosispora scoriae]MBB5869112.1 geranylgeranyl diphosphate synthase type I [Allocatelliglobosispora scoriae]